MGRRYAENTSVTVERSIDEIRRYAERRGAEQLTYAVGPQGGMLRFMLDGHPIQLAAPFPTDYDDVPDAEQEYRRRWRVVLLRVKNAFAIYESEDSVVEAFMPHLMIGDGQTISDAVREQYDRVAGGEIDRFDLTVRALPARAGA